MGQPAGLTARLAIEHVPIAGLRPDPANPRRISDGELEALTRSVQEFGLVDPIIARRDGQVIGGHQRLIAARRLGIWTVPVIYVDLSDEQARLLGLALNRISGDWDRELLGRLLAELQSVPEVDLSLTGFAEDEVAKLLKTIDGREKRHREETFDIAAAWAEAKAGPGVERGDVWSLGDHRVMCGDSTSEADVGRLVAGETARLMVTDPPYGVEYTSPGKRDASRGLRYAAAGRVIENDNHGEAQPEFWRRALATWPLNGDAYIFSPSGPLMIWLALAVEETGIDHHQWLIWAKSRLVPGRGHYHYRHEHIFYGWKGKSSWNGSRKEDSVWEADTPDESAAHPTMKPLPLCEKAIMNSSQPNDLVVEPFLGSGTTLIAAERTGRRCYGMEIDPAYCRVVIARWEAFSGEKAEKVG